MRLLLTGATGAAGSQILFAALSDPGTTAVTVLARRTLPDWLTSELPSNATNKLSTIVVPDFTAPPAGLADHDACIWALGKSTVGMSEQEYTKLTYEYTLAAAKVIEDENKAATTPREKPMGFVYISGEGADRTEKSSVLFARVKGRTENALLGLPPTSGIVASSFRPGYFYPSKERPSWVNAIRPRKIDAIKDKTIGPLVKFAFPAYYTPVNDLAQFTLGLAKGQWEGEGKDGVYSNQDMRRLLKSVKGAERSDL